MRTAPARPGPGCSFQARCSLLCPFCWPRRRLPGAPPLADASVTAVYASHVLEHLGYLQTDKKTACDALIVDAIGSFMEDHLYSQGTRRADQQVGRSATAARPPRDRRATAARPLFVPAHRSRSSSY